MSQTNQILPEDQFSLKDILLKTIALKNLLVKQWKWIVSALVIGAASGFLYDFINDEPNYYTAKITFNLDSGSSPSGGGGGLSDLASAFGIGGGATTGSGLFSGENFYELLKTHALYNRALLTKVKVKGVDKIFAQYYLEKSGVLEDELEDDEELKKLKFVSTDTKKMSLKERKGLNTIYEYLSPVTYIGQDNKRSTFNTLSVTTRNDTLSSLWANLYLETVKKIYTETKTKKTRELVDLVKSRTDSLKTELYISQGKLARFADQNQQIIVQQGLVQQQRLSMSSSQLQGLYFEAERQLDNLRFSIAKESPLLTRIDENELPISPNLRPAAKGAKIGAVIGLIISLLVIFIRKTYQDILSNPV
jgi:hypothetical protein